VQTAGVDRIERVVEVLAGWREQRARGGTADPRALIDAHPDLAPELGAALSVEALLDEYFRRPAERPPERLGGYRVLREIGSGGMGTVYEAEEDATGRRVALKVLPTAYAVGPARERFDREARVLATLDHPNVVRRLDVGAQEGRTFFAMELVEGESLDRAIAAREGRPYDGDVLRLAERFADVADALHAAHGAGVVHRDLKPSNLLLAGDGAIKVADFGLAHLAGAARALTRTGDRLGTPLYMSPEQLAGRRVDARTDVYALGAALYEALASRPPFEGDDPASLAARIAGGPPPPPLRSLAPAVPEALAAAVHRALAREPSERFATAEDLAGALRAAAGR
jgi:serine/threonine protein kinase